MRTRLICRGNNISFQEELDDILDILSKNNSSIVDIKFSTSIPWIYALVMYEELEERK